VYKATIIPRGDALGMVTQLPEDDRNSMTRKVDFFHQQKQRMKDIDC
jgi:ATP-dependent Zn protease